MNGEAAGGSLAERLRRLIAAIGPISIGHYMAEANAHYYNTRDPLGAGGDFVTAPEISQMFGELAGLWLADMWIGAGRPSPVLYVEPGPGRGTLARDALRAMKSCGLEPQVHLVEASAALRRVQQGAVGQATWHHDLSTVPMDAPILLAANEFFDALPVRHLVMTQAGWRERMVIAEGEGFACIAGDRPMDAAVPEERRDAAPGTIIETSPASAAIMGEIGARLARQGGAALVVDYGYTAPQPGSTLQAVRDHRRADPFRDPGAADLSAHVDFAALADSARAAGAKWLGTAPQGAWLRAMGIEARAAALIAGAPHRREEVLGAMERLTGDQAMGMLFKAMGLAHPDWPAGAGLA